MKTHPQDELLGSLRAARWRMRAQAWLERWVRWTLVAGLLLLLAGALWRWGFWPQTPGPLSLPWLAAGLLLPLLGSAAATLLRPVPLEEAARLLDRLGQTRDRFLTALRFAGSAAPFEALALAECRAFLSRENFARRVPVRLPRQARFLAVPLIALAILGWEGRLADQARARAALAAHEQIAPAAGRLEALAKELEKHPDPSREEALRRIAEQLRKSAGELRAENRGADEAAKAALRELTKLEQYVAELQKAAGSVTPQELAQLAKELAKNAATEPASQALAAGHLEEAARRMEAAAGQKDAEQILADALRRLAEQQKASAAMQEMARQMAQAGAEGGKGMEQLAQLLRQMARKPGGAGEPRQGGDGGQPVSPETLKKLLSALQDLKFGEGNEPSDGGGESKPGGDGAPVAVQSFGVSPDGSPMAMDPGAQPSGQPGSEHDEGTTENPFGREAVERAEKGRQSALAGRMGKGESLSQMLSTAGDRSKAQRRYRELYEAMAPAAESAVEQENIPLGSRFFVKRYFQSIRPKE